MLPNNMETSSAIITPSMSSVYEQICLRIIKEQQNIVGDTSWKEAALVPGLQVDAKKQTVLITSEPKETINALVEIYIKLFGRLSREVSKESVVDILADMPKKDIPERLL
jgi:hypothetical protein